LRPEHPYLGILRDIACCPNCVFKLISRHSSSPSLFSNWFRSSVLRIAKKGLLWRKRLARSLVDVKNRDKRRIEYDSNMSRHSLISLVADPWSFFNMRWTCSFARQQQIRGLIGWMALNIKKLLKKKLVTTAKKFCS
jgi:ABC-type oligopeptide transport system substrate-binding subunit